MLQGLKDLLPAHLPAHRGVRHAQRVPVVPVTKKPFKRSSLGGHDGVI